MPQSRQDKTHSSPHLSDKASPHSPPQASSHLSPRASDKASDTGTSSDTPVSAAKKDDGGHDTAMDGPRSNPLIEEMIRVDHAGEYGAVRIYEGQLSVLADSVHAPALRHMLEQEHGHLARFNALLAERRVRPSALSPIWHAAAYALGAVTASMGARTAMACTVAVEDVIDEHYAEQEKTLDMIAESDDDRDLRQTISQFRAEEAEHRDEALRREAEKAPFYPFIASGIKAASRLAIWLSKRV